MRFNKQELVTLATQPSTKFEKEGILYIRERQEGFFRKSEISLERWCRLRGNLLFYFKNRDPWSEPLGVIVLEQCQVRVDPPMASPPLTAEGHYPFYLVFDGGLSQALASTSDIERSSWMDCIRQASYEGIRAEYNALRQCIERRRNHKPNIDLHTWRLQQTHVFDITEVPLCEISLACDNLLCDGHGRPPNPSLVVDVYMPSSKFWVQYGRTEIIERSSNPGFLSTVSFRASDGLSGETRVRFTVFDVRERVSHTAVPLGSACVLLSAIQDSARLRIPLLSRTQATAGFLTVSAWSLEVEDRGSSTEHTPCRMSSHNNAQGSVLGPLLYLIYVNDISNENCTMYADDTSLIATGSNIEQTVLKTNEEIKISEEWFSSNGLVLNMDKTTFIRFSQSNNKLDHSLLLKSNSRTITQTPSTKFLGLDIWILQEKELLQEVAGMGELREPWHSRQVELLDRHLHLLRLYSQAKENLLAHKGSLFKASSRKGDRSLEFAPINLHLQRMWVHNDTLNKSGFYDWITVGAFTAHSHKSKNGGLIRLVQQLKESPSKSSSNYQITTKISMANDAIQKKIYFFGKTLMRLAKEKQTNGMLPICEDMISKTRILLSLWDPGLVEEALNFIEQYKLIVNEDSGVGEDLSLESGGRPSLILSPFKRITQQLTSLDLKSPDLEDFATPCTPMNVEDIWKVSNQSRDNNRIDSSQSRETKQNTNFHMFINFQDIGNNKLMDNSSEITEPSSLTSNTNNTEPRSLEPDTGRRFLDTNVMCNSPSANYYKPTDEPEPWDITQLNIEASVMCLVSKVKFLCGRCNSPAVRLKQNARNVKRNVITDQPSGGNIINKEAEAVSKAVNKVVRNGNKFTDGLDLNKISDWSAELRPSMRKLRQAMDGLLKTARLTHSVFRVQEDPKAAQRVCNVRYRRDVCFSQALTSLVAGLMTRLWCHKPDPAFVAMLNALGPLASFEGLLSYYGNEIDMWGDMSVAIEDLRTVLFILVRSPSPATEPHPNPKVSGTRNSLTVSLPVPDTVYSLIPTRQTLSFHVTPVFFNIGINEMATIAEGIGATRPQERSNVDNFERLNEYYLRYRKLNIPDKNAFASRMSACSPQLRSLNDLIENLRTSVHSSKAKNVEILHLAAQICRQINGIRFTSCKSAKDRTGMSITLEECLILADEYHLAEHEFQKALDCLRSEGCRRENTLKNIGISKYAFNSMQLLAFPKLYRPPPGTYGSAQS
nr:type I inositol 3,4-bisphosphate 4-phosphatase [Leptinotarsa decemlineata]